MALYYMCNKGIYYNVYHFKNKVTIRSGQRDVTVKHVERGSDNEMAGNVMSENKKTIISLRNYCFYLTLKIL